jgi:hypothetical protein
MQLMNTAILRNRDFSNVCRNMFHVTSAIIHWHSENQRKPEIALPSVRDGMKASTE